MERAGGKGDSKACTHISPSPHQQVGNDINAACKGQVIMVLPTHYLSARGSVPPAPAVARGQTSTLWSLPPLASNVLQQPNGGPIRSPLQTHHCLGPCSSAALR